MALLRTSSAPVGLAQRARSMLLAADRVSNTELALRVGVSSDDLLADPLCQLGH
jgi:hypothetical protein